MKTFKQLMSEKGRCWTGYKPVPGKKAFSKGSCAPVRESNKDDVGEMIKDKLRIIIHNAEKMHDELKNTDDLPEWVKSKITLAQDYVSTAYDYTCGTHDLKEDGMGAGGMSAGPTNVVGGGAIAGTGGKGGEPGVNMKKKKAHNPVMGMTHRKNPKF
jgi:hypothetical protein